MPLVAVRTDKRGFATPVTPISSQGEMRWARSFEEIVDDMLNAEQEFVRILHTTPTAKTLASHVLTPTLGIHTVTSQSGTSDYIDTITAVNNTYLILKATATHTITLKHGTGNINVPGRNDVVMTGNAAVLLFCENGQWTHIGTYSAKMNITATTDPGSGDDSGDGYIVGSFWVNTQRDRVWVCVDNTLTTAIWKRVGSWINGWRIRAANTVAVGDGIAAPTLSTNSSASVNDSSNTYLKVSTDGTATDTRGIITASFDLVRPGHDPVFEVHLKMIDAKSENLWIGMISTAPTNVDTLAAGTKFIGFHSNFPGTTGRLQPVLNDGSAQTNGSNLVTLADNTVYKLRCRVNYSLSTAYFSVNDGAEQALSSHFPDPTTDMGFCVRMFGNEIAARQFNFASAEVRW
jgi:hypothetical protein